MIRKICLLATLLLPATALNAATIVLANGDFEGGAPASDYDPTGWTTTEAANKVYAFAGANPITSTVLHIKDIDTSGTPQSSILQSLTTNNVGLTGATYGDYTLTLDLGWRSDETGAGAATGNATLRFSLVNFANPTVVLGFTNYTLNQRADPLNNVYALTQDNLAINITYDNTLLANQVANIGLLITRTDGDSPGTENESVMWMDNLSVTAIPEPSAALLGGLGLLALLRRRRN
jgi:MYXO-CTERM domain-containing protein